MHAFQLTEKELRLRVFAHISACTQSSIHPLPCHRRSLKLSAVVVLRHRRVSRPSIPNIATIVFVSGRITKGTWAHTHTHIVRLDSLPICYTSLSVEDYQQFQPSNLDLETVNTTVKLADR